jgi:DNA-directed RNA polymerase specialized sigma24 family protein
MTTPDPSPDDAFQRAAEELWMPVYRFALALTNDLGEADDGLRGALARLTAAERTAVLLSAVEDWTPEEIGAALGISAGAVRAAASRGRAKLGGLDS